MKDHFLKLLNQKKDPTYLGELYGDYPYYDQLSVAVEEKKVVPVNVTEKEKTLQAFKDFAEEKIEKNLEQGQSKVVFPGLEIIAKANTLMSLLNEDELSEIDNLVLGPLNVFKNISLDNKVVFLDLNTPNTGQEIELTSTQNQTNDLLKKIISATADSSRLVLINYSIGDHPKVISQEETETSIANKILLEIAYLMRNNGVPKVILTLGSKATNCLLKKEDKISRLRGQFIERTIFDKPLSFVPLFHPERLLINPNMKSTTWEDLKKVINFIKS